MAVELGAAYISLIPSMKGFAPAVSKQLGATTAVSAAAGAKSGAAYSGGFSKGVAGMKAGALAIGAGIGALAASSINLEKQFSQSMNMIGANTGAPKKDLDELKKLAIDLGASTSFSANEAAAAMLELSKSGLTPATIQSGALAGTLQLAAAGGTSLENAATIASNALNTFNLEGKDMASISAALAGGANASTASVESLGQALSQVGPGAKNAGLDLNDTVGVLAAFDDAGIKGSDAGTSLKTMLTRLVPTTKAAAQEMKDLGLKFTDAQGNFLPITNIAQQLQDKMSGLSEAERTAAMSTIFGSDATRAATVLMEEGSKGVGKYIKATKDRGAAEKAAEARMSGTAGALERLSGSWETFRLQLGLKIAPIVQTVSDKLGTLIDFLGKHSDVVIKAALVVSGFAAAVLGLNVAIKVASAVTKAWSAITAAWTVVTKVATVATKALGFAIRFATGPIGLIITAITLAVGALVWFFTKTKLGKKIIAVAWAGIKTAIKAVADWWTKTAWPAIKKVITAFQVGFQVAKKAIGVAWAGIKTAAGNAWAWIKKWVFLPFRIYIGAWKLAFKTAKTVITAAWTGIRKGLGAGWAWIRDNVFSKIKSGIGAVKDAFGKARDGIKTIWNKIKKIVAAPINFVIEKVYGGAEDAKSGIRPLVGKVFKWLGKDNPLPVMNKIGFARGGWTGPGSKYQPAGIVHADEFVVSKASRRSIERQAPGALDYMNRTGRFPGYAGGGLVAAAKWWQAKGARLSEHPLFGGVRAGHMRGSEHYKGNAVDLNYGPGGQNATEMKFFDRYVGIFRRLFPSINTLWRVPNHFNHMHIDGGGGGSRVGRGGSFGSNSSLLSIIRKLGALKDKMSGELFSGPLGEMLRGVGKKIVNGPIQWVRDLLGNLGDDGKGHEYTGNTDVQKKVRAVASKYGWGFGSQWGALDWLINKESSWNPNAANPSSTARGLFQKMTSIHGPLEKTIEGQAKWGLDYIKNRYGTPVAAQMFHQGHGYYADGGRVLPKLYDKGGWLPQGLSVVENRTGKPEPVLTSDQWDRMSSQNQGPLIGQLVVRDEQTAVREFRREQQRQRVRNNMAGRR